MEHDLLGDFVFLNNSDFEQQIVMVSPGTHLVKNHESLSITNESQLKYKTKESQIENAKPLCNQTVNLETDVKTLYYNLLKLKYSPSIYLEQFSLDCRK